MSRSQLAVIMVMVTAYLVWLVVFLLVVERWVRRLVGWILGVTITREFATLTGPSQNVQLLDALFVFSWRVAEPAGLSIRFAVGLLRLLFWFTALALPIIAGLAFYLWLNR